MLANDPQVVVADEPAEALDTKNAAAVFAIQSGLARQVRTMIAIIQDEDLAAAAQQSVHVVDGRVVRDGVQA